jgi:hypothetical protein
MPMMSTMKHSRIPFTLPPLIAALALVPVTVHGAGTDGAADTAAREACITSFERAQTLREEGKLVAAKRALEICAEASCPEFVSSECVTWLEEVTAQIPSVVIGATGADGDDTSAVRVTLDGELVSETLDGKPLEVDPGQHAFIFEHGGLPPIELQVLVKQGEQSRLVEVSFTPEGGVTADPVVDDGAPGWAMPVMLVGFGLGAVGLGVGAVTGGMAASQTSELEDNCPDDQCPLSSTEEDLNSALTLADVSTVGFIVGGVCAAVGVVGLVFTIKGSGSDTSEALRLEPTVGLGAFGLRGRF